MVAHQGDVPMPRPSSTTTGGTTTIHTTTSSGSIKYGEAPSSVDKDTKKPASEEAVPGKPWQPSQPHAEVTKPTPGKVQPGQTVEEPVGGSKYPQVGFMAPVSL